MGLYGFGIGLFFRGREEGFRGGECGFRELGKRVYVFLDWGERVYF